MIRDLVRHEDGVVILGDCLDREVSTEVITTTGPLPLIIADPPYGNIVPEGWDDFDGTQGQFVEWMLKWTNLFSTKTLPGGALYVWGGVGRPSFRPFYQYLSQVESESAYELANHITWGKKRAYGVQHNYLFTREELAYLTLGDVKKPRKFTVPLLETKRGYAGYNAKYPAKSEFFRRTNVWTDITEILRGKKHPCEKPTRLHEILIEIHTEKGEWVLDPFAGAGTTGVAARKLGRKFVLIDNDPVSFKTCVEQLAR